MNISYKSRLNYLFVYFTTFLFLLSALPILSYASTTISPILIEEDIVPGQNLTKKIKVVNNDSESHIYYIDIKNIKDVGEGGVPIFAKSGEFSNFELSSWLRTSVSNFSVLPGQSYEFTLSVDVPTTNVDPGAHLGGVTISRNPPDKSQVSQGSSVGYELITIISLEVAGKKFSDAQLYNFSTDHFLYSRPEVKFNITVGNLGNTLVRPVGAIVIKDMFGKERGQIDVNKSEVAVIPGGRREFTADWSGDPFAFGKYTAFFVASYGRNSEGKQSICGLTCFWILPMNIIGPVLGGLLLISLVLFILVRLYVRRQLRGVVRGEHQRTSKVIIICTVTVLFLIFFLGTLFFLFA